MMHKTRKFLWCNRIPFLKEYIISACYVIIQKGLVMTKDSDWNCKTLTNNGESKGFLTGPASYAAVSGMKSGLSWMTYQSRGLAQLPPVLLLKCFFFFFGFVFVVAVKTLMGKGEENINSDMCSYTFCSFNMGNNLGVTATASLRNEM